MSRMTNRNVNVLFFLLTIIVSVDVGKIFDEEIILVHFF